MQAAPQKFPRTPSLVPESPRRGKPDLQYNSSRQEDMTTFLNAYVEDTDSGDRVFYDIYSKEDFNDRIHKESTVPGSLKSFSGSESLKLSGMAESLSKFRKRQFESHVAMIRSSTYLCKRFKKFGLELKTILQSYLDELESVHGGYEHLGSGDKLFFDLEFLESMGFNQVQEHSEEVSKELEKAKKLDLLMKTRIGADSDSDSEDSDSQGSSSDADIEEESISTSLRHRTKKRPYHRKNVPSIGSVGTFGSVSITNTNTRSHPAGNSSLTLSSLPRVAFGMHTGSDIEMEEIEQQRYGTVELSSESELQLSDSQDSTNIKDHLGIERGTSLSISTNQPLDILGLLDSIEKNPEMVKKANSFEDEEEILSLKKVEQSLDFQLVMDLIREEENEENELSDFVFDEAVLSMDFSGFHDKQGKLLIEAGLEDPIYKEKNLDVLFRRAHDELPQKALEKLSEIRLKHNLDLLLQEESDESDFDIDHWLDSEASRKNLSETATSETSESKSKKFVDELEEEKEDILTSTDSDGKKKITHGHYATKVTIPIPSFGWEEFLPIFDSILFNCVPHIRITSRVVDSLIKDFDSLSSSRQNDVASVFEENQKIVLDRLKTIQHGLQQERQKTIKWGNALASMQSDSALNDYLKFDDQHLLSFKLCQACGEITCPSDCTESLSSLKKKPTSSLVFGDMPDSELSQSSESKEENQSDYMEQHIAEIEDRILTKVDIINQTNNNLSQKKQQQLHHKTKTLASKRFKFLKHYERHQAETHRATVELRFTDEIYGELLTLKFLQVMSNHLHSITHSMKRFVSASPVYLNGITHQADKISLESDRITEVYDSVTDLVSRSNTIQEENCGLLLEGKTKRRKYNFKALEREMSMSYSLSGSKSASQTLTYAGIDSDVKRVVKSASLIQKYHNPLSYYTLQKLHLKIVSDSGMLDSSDEEYLFFVQQRQTDKNNTDKKEEVPPTRPNTPRRAHSDSDTSGSDPESRFLQHRAQRTRRRSSRLLEYTRMRELESNKTAQELSKVLEQETESYIPRADSQCFASPHFSLSKSERRKFFDLTLPNDFRYETSFEVSNTVTGKRCCYRGCVHHSIEKGQYVLTSSVTRRSGHLKCLMNAFTLVGKNIRVTNIDHDNEELVSLISSFQRTALVRARRSLKFYLEYRKNSSFSFQLVESPNSHAELKLGKTSVIDLCEMSQKNFLYLLKSRELLPQPQKPLYMSCHYEFHIGDRISLNSQEIGFFLEEFRIDDQLTKLIIIEDPGVEMNTIEIFDEFSVLNEEEEPQTEDRDLFSLGISKSTKDTSSVANRISKHASLSSPLVTGEESLAYDYIDSTNEPESSFEYSDFNGIGLSASEMLTVLEELEVEAGVSEPTPVSFEDIDSYFEYYNISTPKMGSRSSKSSFQDPLSYKNELVQITFDDLFDQFFQDCKLKIHSSLPDHISVLEDFFTDEFLEDLKPLLLIRFELVLYTLMGDVAYSVRPELTSLFFDEFYSGTLRKEFAKRWSKAKKEDNPTFTEEDIKKDALSLPEASKPPSSQNGERRKSTLVLSFEDRQFKDSIIENIKTLLPFTMEEVFPCDLFSKTPEFLVDKILNYRTMFGKTAEIHELSDFSFAVLESLQFLSEIQEKKLEFLEFKTPQETLDSRPPVQHVVSHTSALKPGTKKAKVPPQLTLQTMVSFGDISIALEPPSAPDSPVITPKVPMFLDVPDPKEKKKKKYDHDIQQNVLNSLLAEKMSSQLDVEHVIVEEEASNEQKVAFDFQSFKLTPEEDHQIKTSVVTVPDIAPEEKKSEVVVTDARATILQHIASTLTEFELMHDYEEKDYSSMFKKDDPGQEKSSIQSYPGQIFSTSPGNNKFHGPTFDIFSESAFQSLPSTINYAHVDKTEFESMLLGNQDLHQIYSSYMNENRVRKREAGSAREKLVDTLWDFSAAQYKRDSLEYLKVLNPLVDSRSPIPRSLFGTDTPEETPKSSSKSDTEYLRQFSKRLQEDNIAVPAYEPLYRKRTIFKHICGEPLSRTTFDRDLRGTVLDRDRFCSQPASLTDLDKICERSKNYLSKLVRVNKIIEDYVDAQKYRGRADQLYVSEKLRPVIEYDTAELRKRMSMLTASEIETLATTITSLNSEPSVEVMDAVDKYCAELFVKPKVEEPEVGVELDAIPPPDQNSLAKPTTFHASGLKGRSNSSISRTKLSVSMSETNIDVQTVEHLLHGKTESRFVFPNTLHGSTIFYEKGPANSEQDTKGLLSIFVKEQTAESVVQEKDVIESQSRLKPSSVVRLKTAKEDLKYFTLRIQRASISGELFPLIDRLKPYRIENLRIEHRIFLQYVAERYRRLQLVKNNQELKKVVVRDEKFSELKKKYVSILKLSSHQLNNIELFLEKGSPLEFQLLLYLKDNFATENFVFYQEVSSLIDVLQDKSFRQRNLSSKRRQKLFRRAVSFEIHDEFSQKFGKNPGPKSREKSGLQKKIGTFMLTPHEKLELVQDFFHEFVDEATSLTHVNLPSELTAMLRKSMMTRNLGLILESLKSCQKEIVNLIWANLSSFKNSDKFNAFLRNSILRSESERKEIDKLKDEDTLKRIEATRFQKLKKKGSTMVDMLRVFMQNDVDYFFDSKS